MEKLICKESKNYKITPGTEYEVLRNEREYVIIRNDNNKVVRYAKNLFDSIPDIQEEPAPVAPRRGRPRNQERPQPAAQAVPVVNRNLSLEEIIQSIRLSTEEEGILLKFNTSIQNNNNVFSEIAFEYGILNLDESANCSCGVTDGSGVDGVFGEIENIVSEINHLNADQKNALMKELFKRTIKFMIDHCSRGQAFVILSTTTDDEVLVDALSEMSHMTTEPRENPNSGNQIMLWVI